MQSFSFSSDRDSIMSVFVILGVLVCMEAAGSTDVKTVFVQTGNDVLLEIRDPSVVEDYLLFAWIVDEKDSRPEIFVSWTDNGIKPKVIEKYKETVFPLANYSVMLKNLQKTDSGLYYAQLFTIGETTLVRYNITVEDPVSPVKVTVTSVSSSPDSCNVTVSCTTDDFTISRTMTCTNQTCTNQGDKSQITLSDTSLHIYLSDDSITCNHSNHVTWTTASVHLKLICPDDAGPQGVSADVIVLRVKIAVFSVGLVVMVSAVLGVHFTKTTVSKKGNRRAPVRDNNL